jgi:hypothetical protein
MKLNYLLIIASLLVLSSCGLLRNMMTSDTFAEVQGQSDSISYSPIKWHLDTTIEGNVEETSIFVPVTLNGISQNLYMQFDLGSNITGFYGNTLKALAEKYPELDTHLVQGKRSTYFKNAELGINKKYNKKANKLYIWEDLGQSDLDTSFLNFVNAEDDAIILGTIGYDVLGSQVLILDLKDDRYALTSAIPADIKGKADFIDEADLNKFPILLPFRFGGKKITLIYDTGSGNFPVLTGTNRLKRLADETSIDTVDKASRFGELHNVYRLKNAGDISLEDIEFGNFDVYGMKIFNKFWFIGLYGLTGNNFFKDKVVVIDRKNNKFGLIE